MDPGYTTDAEAEAVARSFVRDNADLLRAELGGLEVEQVVRGAGKVAVHFVQRFHGVPVEGGRVMLVFGEEGRLFVFGSSFFRNIAVSPVPSVTATSAEGIAQADLPFNPTTDEILSAAALRVLPVAAGDADVEHHLVWRTVVGTSEPYGAWVTDVDAQSGRIIQRVNDIHGLYSGTVTGDVDEGAGYCTGPAVHPIRDMDIDIGGLGTVTTAPDGSFSIPGSGGNRTLDATWDGTHADITDVQFGTSQINTTIDENVPLALHWSDATPSRRTERDVFYMVSATNAFVTNIDPAWSIPKHTVDVNRNATCNANWTTWHMNFFREGGGCANTGVINDVVAHEYGHGIQHTLIGSQGTAQGMGEGNSDISGTNMIDDSVIGRGFYLNDCTRGIRNCENTLRYPENVLNQPSPHAAGRVICGFNWDTRQALEISLGQAAGKAKAAELWHFARKLLVPNQQPAQVLAYFVTDDDDANLNNGTPHHAEICEGATNHGFECPEILLLTIAHDPIGSTTNHATSFTAEAEVLSEEATVDVVDLFYRVDGGPFVQVAMTQIPDNFYSAEIPAQSEDAKVEYYIFAHDTDNNERTDPRDAPAVLHTFFVATVIDEIEVESGWTAGVPGDDATTGIWLRADPVGTAAQPEDDHTPAPGTDCYVTGNAQPGQSIGTNDVDGGTTTLLSPIYDLSTATAMAKVSYFRWYSNNQGNAPNSDFWVVDVSNDGGSTWTSVENVNPPNNEQNVWLPIEVDIIALFAIPDQVQLRFKASDLGSGSIVEAAVDDLVILTRGGALAVESPAESAPVRFAVGPNRPNPFNPATTITYSLPERSEVRVSVFDVSGREVRQLLNQVQEAGERSVEWNGVDDAGQALSSGVYYYRVEANGLSATRKMVMIK
jgi:hypothetical protein